MLLQVAEHIPWKTPAKRSREYVDKVLAALGDRVVLNRTVRSVKRTRQAPAIAKNTCDDSSAVDLDPEHTMPPATQAAASEQFSITITDSEGCDAYFDEVIFACHADQTLRILGDEASDLERELLSNFRYSSNATYIHSDAALMPKARAAWTSWNYISNNSLDCAASNSKPVFVTYWLNKLQSLNHSRDIFVSLNPDQPPAADKTHAVLNYAHPQYSPDAVRAQRRIAVELQGERGTYFSGAWMCYGFHEDGFRSGIEVAEAVSGQKAPWADKLETLYTSDAVDSEVAPFKKEPAVNSTILSPHARNETALTGTYQGSLFTVLLQALGAPIVWVFEKVCQQQVLSFLSTGFQNGELTFVLPGDWRYLIRPSDKVRSTTASSRGAPGTATTINTKVDTLSTALMAITGSGGVRSAAVKVNNPWFFVRLALEADLGLARSYIAGEWEVIPQNQPQQLGDNYEAMVNFLILMIENMPTGKTSTRGGLDTRELLTATIGTALNHLWYRLTMDNTIANSQSNIHAVRTKFTLKLSSQFY